MDTHPHRHADSAVWADALDALLPDVHPVDANAVRIWFAFFPLALADALADTDDIAGFVRRLRLEGDYRLATQPDTSHAFLYGHRYWSAVTQAILSTPAMPPAVSGGELATRIRGTAREAAAHCGAGVSLLVGITAVGLMTQQQLGGAGVGMAPGGTSQAGPELSPTQRLSARTGGRIDLMRLFRPVPVHRVTFDERQSDGYFSVLGRQELTTGAATDTRPYEMQGRLTLSGPIPTDCRSGTCGTCWVGVLAGADRLSDVEPTEAKRLRACGYSETAEAKPLIRLACQARAAGDVTIVIPPWNGVLGRYARPPVTG